MKLTRKFLWHWRVDSASPVWIADAELDLSGFANTTLLSFSADVVIESAASLSIVITSGGGAEQIGTTTNAVASEAGPFVGRVHGAPVAGINPAQGKILLHLSASVSTGAADFRNVSLTLSDE
jgi:hypothetical protein